MWWINRRDIDGNMKTPNFGRRFTLIWAALATLAVAVVTYPIYVIQPFRQQGARELAVALTVIRFRPYLEVVCAVGAVLAAIWYFRVQRKWRFRLVAAAGAIVVIGIACLGLVNVYELMFHPVERPTFSTASRARLDGDEQVIAVNVHGRARAYPIRSISYHHIVNDTLGREPIVATY